MQWLRGFLFVIGLLSAFTACTPDDQKCSQDRVGKVAACQTACDQGHMPSCLSAARTFDQKFEQSASRADAEQAVSLYERACEAGLLDACVGATWGILLGPSQDKPDLPPPSVVDRAPERRRALLAKGCGLEDRKCCIEASDAFLGEDRSKAEQLGRKACALEFGERGKREACEAERRSLAALAEEGAAACKSGLPGGCLTLGKALIHFDKGRAREAFERECKRRRLLRDGKTDACVEVYEQTATARALPAAEPSIVDRPHARVILLSVTMDPSRPERPSSEQVREVIDEGTKSLEACYASALSRNPKLKGSLTLLFTIDGLGHSWNVREQDLMLVDVRAVECVKQRASHWRFEEPKRDTIDVEAKLVFRIERP
jgi:hypothetical protein